MVIIIRYWRASTKSSEPTEFLVQVEELPGTQILRYLHLTQTVGSRKIINPTCQVQTCIRSFDVTIRSMLYARTEMNTQPTDGIAEKHRVVIILI